MTESEAARLSADEESAYTLEGFWAAFSELAGVSSARVSGARQRAAALEVEHAAWRSDAPSARNLRYGCAVLAGYEALRPLLPVEPALALLRAAFLQSGAPVREKMRAFLDQSPDPFADLVAISKQREAEAFGSGFVFERERDDDQAYLLNVRRCFWDDFFASAAVPELTRVLCEFDRNWFEAIEPERHGLRFERETTLGQGGTHCPFHFFRLARRPA